jgi:diaminopimelate epimerase
MSSSLFLAFSKMHGLGNDFIVVDGSVPEIASLPWTVYAPSLCDRAHGVGADGVLLLSPEADGTIRMSMWNPDGSESGMCGNGLRCAARWAWEQGWLNKDSISFRTQAGTHAIRMAGADRISVDMGPPRWSRAEIGITGPAGETWAEETVSWPGGSGLAWAVSFGNPHMVVRAEGALAHIGHAGPTLEHHPDFPHRTNIHFVEVNGPQFIQMVTWERGAGLTLACGSGACAVASVGLRNGWVSAPVTISLPGGELEISEEGGRVWMTGPATRVFEGVVPLPIEFALDLPFTPVTQ